MEVTSAVVYTAKVNFVKKIASLYIHWHFVIIRIFAAVKIKNSYYKKSLIRKYKAIHNLFLDGIKVNQH